MQSETITARTVCSQVSGRLGTALAASSSQPVDTYRAPLLARVHLRLGLWSWTAEVRHPVPAADEHIQCLAAGQWACAGDRRCSRDISINMGPAGVGVGLQTAQGLLRPLSI